MEVVVTGVEDFVRVRLKIMSSKAAAERHLSTIGIFLRIRLYAKRIDVSAHSALSSTLIGVQVLNIAIKASG